MLCGVLRDPGGIDAYSLNCFVLRRDLYNRSQGSGTGTPYTGLGEPTKPTRYTGSSSES